MDIGDPFAGMTVEECKEQRAILEIGLLRIAQATVDVAVVEHEPILCFQIPGVRMSPRPVDPNLSWRTSKPEGNSVETRTTAGNAFSLKQALQAYPIGSTARQRRCPRPRRAVSDRGV